jgi:predicted XRE-type DNA-binding protein
MKNKQYESVWDAIEDTPEEAESMKLRANLMMALKQRITNGHLNQSQAASLFGVTQPRISDLMRGKINLFGLDSLINMAAVAGLHVEMSIQDTRAFVPPKATYPEATNHTP